MNLLVTIIKPTQSSKYDAQFIEALTNAGSLIIQYGHAPLIALLPAQELRVHSSNKMVQAITISSSIMRVERSSITIICNE